MNGTSGDFIAVLLFGERGSRDREAKIFNRCVAEEEVNSVYIVIFKCIKLF